VVREAAAVIRDVFHVFIAVPVAIAVHPLQRSRGMRAQRTHEFAVAGQTVRGGEQHQEQRRRVDRPVVREVWDEALVTVDRTGPMLVQDLARLFERERVYLRALQARKGMQHSLREFRIEGKYLIGRDEGIAPNRAMNQGIPAAITASPSADDSPLILSAARSYTLRS
jgi:hypothetical protein